MKKEINENQEVKSPKDKVRGRLSSRFPDRSFVGTDGIEDIDAIDSSIDELLGEYETRENEYNENSRRLADLFANNPRAARMFMAWAEGGDLMGHLIENFGDEFMDALQSEEGKAKFAEGHRKWLDKVAANKKADAEAEENFVRSIESLQAFQQEHNLTDEKAIELFDQVKKIGSDAAMGIYEPATFQMVFNAMNHDTDVSAARTEGEINGRNAKIKSGLRSGDNLPDLPPSLGGQSPAAGVKKPNRPKRDALDMFGLK